MTLALTIRSHEYLRGLGTSACAKAHCVALSLLRKSLMNAEGQFRIELIAASMCLSLAEVIEPRKTIGEVFTDEY